jgi:hypothetical protein
MERPRRIDRRAAIVAAVWLGLAAAALLALGLVALARPDLETVKEPRHVAERAVLAYEAVPSRRGVYQDGLVTTGEPVFLRLVDRVSFDFAYRLSGRGPVSVGGTASLVAVLGDSSGWTRSFVLAGPSSFSQRAVRLHGDLDLRAIERAVHQFRESTGSTADTYEVVVRAEVRVRGTSGGRGFEDVFEPELPFRLDGVRLALALEGARPGRGGVVTSRWVPGSRLEPATLSVLGLELPVGQARPLGILGGLGTALAATLLVLGALLARDRSEAGRIAERYADVLVPVASLPRAGTVVTVSSFDALAQLAERGGRAVLAAVAGESRVYAVEQDGVLYRFQPADPVRADVPAGTTAHPAAP